MSSNVSRDALRAYIDRIERLEEDKKAVANDIKDIYSEAKGNGYDTKIIRKVVSLRRKSKEERQEEEALLELYMQTLEME